jgi:hypothetical protein
VTRLFPLALSLWLPLVPLPPSLFLLIALSLALIQSFSTSRVGIIGSNLLVTRPVLSSCYFSMAAACFSPTAAFSSACCFSHIPLPHNREFVTSRLDIGGSNLLMTYQVIPPGSVAVSSFSTSNPSFATSRVGTSQ